MPLAIKWTGLRVVDTDLFELNEALAAQSQAVRKDLSVEQDRVDISLSAARDIRSEAIFWVTRITVARRNWE